ncbi:DUF922 domain-containing protein [Fulvimarina sp. MAC3]|uniref:DUF922 domain-containing protein n=1 Tax=Fulvimarina sp. MAC3 TaxID=3148887 RepID=UPI0031FDE850
MTACVAPRSQVSTSYYEVSGQTSDQLVRDIARKAPNNGKWFAMVSIQFVPVALEPDLRGGMCRFKRVRLRVKADITLPLWRERNFAKSKDLRQGWDGHAEYARIHEDFHVKIAELFARKMESSLLALPAHRNCKELGASATKIVRRLHQLHGKAQDEFDELEEKRITRLIAASKRARRAGRGR